MTLALVDGTSEARHVRRALFHYARALSLYPRTELPHKYAATLFNRCQGLLRAALSHAQPERFLHEACTCFAEAAEEFARLNDAELLRRCREQMEQISIFEPCECGNSTAQESFNV
jgi:hypothetical protein